MRAVPHFAAALRGRCVSCSAQPEENMTVTEPSSAQRSCMDKPFPPNKKTVFQERAAPFPGQKRRPGEASLRAEAMPSAPCRCQKEECWLPQKSSGFQRLVRGGSAAPRTTRGSGTLREERPRMSNPPETGSPALKEPPCPSATHPAPPPAGNSLRALPSFCCFFSADVPLNQEETPAADRPRFSPP